MKIKNLVLGAMLAIGCGVGFNVSAYSLEECCRIMQQECELNYSPASCRSVYRICIRDNHCMIN